MKSFTIGQRWISDMEPELGVGIITEVSARMVRIVFPAAEEERQYAIASAPIQRLEFKIGDTIQTSDGQKHTVADIQNDNGLLAYICDNTPISEKDLDSVFSFTSPKDRLLSGFYDSNAAYNLRIKSLKWRARHAQSPAFGFMGGRIDLIPHQLYVALQTATRQAPRVLLSDEVGLGKTIEACLILHRLLLSRRIGRVLIIVPESLVHQWFVELLRRFNLVFRIIDAEYVDSLPEENGNPFEDDQLALLSLDYLVSHPALSLHALQAQWDMVVVDEAHHILEDSAEYKLVDQLAQQSLGLLLLTATPEQLGHRSHFARLRLLDPSRYHDFNKFEQEIEHYHQTADLVTKLVEKKPLSDKEFKSIQHLDDALVNKKALSSEKRQSLIRQLLDRYGMGRVILRNTRAAIPNFPKRKAHLVPLASSKAQLEIMRNEFLSDLNSLQHTPDLKDDSRILWLSNFLKKHDDKILLICHTLEKTFAIEKALQNHISVKAALFHENLTLLQRDRNAAWFSEPDGAQLLICSEIGSEGRNFQFSHHLVLFDLPFDPELLEQRIGRLDRIGQKQTINIHIPYVSGSPQEALVRWYHEGFHAFEENAADAYLIYEQFGKSIQDVAQQNNTDQLHNLIEQTKQFHADMSKQLESGRNRLLELNSYDEKIAAGLIDEITAIEKESDFEELMVKLFEHFDVAHEAHDDLHVIGHDHLTYPDFPFPAFRRDRFPVTFDRNIALSREEIEFLTPDHPMALGAIDLILASEKGNAVLAIWPSDEQGLLLETFFVLECVAPARLFINRFFPPTPLRLLVNHKGNDLTAKFSLSALNKLCKTSSSASIFDNPTIKQKLFPDMLEQCYDMAEKKADQTVRDNLEFAMNSMNDEIGRLESLRNINSTISEQEINLLKVEKAELQQSIESARIRLDSIRFIFKGSL